MSKESRQVLGELAPEIESAKHGGLKVTFYVDTDQTDPKAARAMIAEEFPETVWKTTLAKGEINLFISAADKPAMAVLQGNIKSAAGRAGVVSHESRGNVMNLPRHASMMHSAV